MSPSDSVTLAITGTITESCAIDLDGGGTDLDLGTLSTVTPSAQEALAFKINCNAPFDYSLESENGALANTTGTVASGSDAIDSSLAYTVRFQAALEDGDTAAIDQSCSSASIDDALTATDPSRCAFVDSGTSVAIDESASLTVSVDTEGKVLLAGTYRDRITLRVGIRP